MAPRPVVGAAAAAGGLGRRLARRVADDVEVREVPVALAQVEAVADEEVVRCGEADVAHRQVVDESPVRPVEQRHGGKRGRPPKLERVAQVVQRQARVDDVLDEDDVSILQRLVEVLEQADAPSVTAAVVGGKLQEVEPVDDRQRPRQVREEYETCLERGDEQRLAAAILARESVAELADARGDLPGGEVDLSDPRVRYEARSSPYRCASRSMSRL